ncbi:MAG: hypothetical protein WA902_08610 [Thermosynechococcaceae cyanobacterium]
MHLLVTSIRDIEDIVCLAAQGFDAFTVSDEIASQLFDVDATAKAAEAFEEVARMST